MIPFAVVRTREFSGTTPLSEEDVFLTLATDPEDAILNADAIGWRASDEEYDEAMHLANPNYGTEFAPLYARPTFVENTLLSISSMFKTKSRPAYYAVPVEIVNGILSTPYVLAYGAGMGVPPKVTCYYEYPDPDVMEHAWHCHTNPFRHRLDFKVVVKGESKSFTTPKRAGPSSDMSSGATAPFAAKEDMTSFTLA
jgi:hypothetical protein